MSLCQKRVGVKIIIRAHPNPIIKITGLTVHGQKCTQHLVQVWSNTSVPSHGYLERRGKVIEQDATNEAYKMPHVQHVGEEYLHEGISPAHALPQGTLRPPGFCPGWGNRRKGEDTAGNKF